jgi:RNA polymerase subunit RPABC4/transcription elongation factor Spt4
MSKTKECPGCAMDVDAKADVCPICEYDFPRQSIAAQIAVFFLIILMLLWLLF